MLLSCASELSCKIYSFELFNLLYLFIYYFIINKSCYHWCSTCGGAAGCMRARASQPGGVLFTLLMMYFYDLLFFGAPGDWVDDLHVVQPLARPGECFIC